MSDPDEPGDPEGAEETGNGGSRSAADEVAPDDPREWTAKQSRRLEERIVEVIRADPASSTRDIVDAVDRPRSTVRYHLDRLEDQGRITREVDGNAVRHYVGSPTLGDRLQPYLRDPARRKVLTYVAEHTLEDVSINGLAQAVDVSERRVKRALEGLDRLEIIALERDGFHYEMRKRRDVAALLDEALDD